MMNNDLLIKYEDAITNCQKIYEEMIMCYENIKIDEIFGMKNIILEQIIKLEKLSNYSSIEKEFKTIEEKRKIFSNILRKIEKEISLIIKTYQFSDKLNFKIELLCMYIYTIGLILHIVNFRGYNVQYNIDCDNFTNGIIDEIRLNFDIDKKKKLDAVETCLTRISDTMIILLIFNEKYNNYQGLQKELQYVNLHKLFYAGFSYHAQLDMMYDFTEGLDRTADMRYNEDLILDTNDELDTFKINADCVDYKMFIDDSKMDNKLLKILNKKLKNKFGFDLNEGEKLLKIFNDEQNKITCKSNVEWVELITLCGIEIETAKKIFQYFSLKLENDNDISFEIFCDTRSRLENHIFLNTYDNYYLSNEILLNYGWNLFKQTICNSPNKILGSSIIGDKISDEFVSSVKKLIIESYPDSIVVSNFYLNEIVSSDYEIDILMIYKNYIIIFECKRIEFPRNRKAIKNATKMLMDKYTKQLNTEIKEVNKYKESILNKFIGTSNFNIEKYKILGFLVIKEFSFAQIKSDNIIQINDLISRLNKLLE